MRVFFAVSLGKHCQRQIAQRTESLRQHYNSGELRFVPSQNYHITLAFLGDVDSDKLDLLDDVANKVASQHQQFTLRLQCADWFPGCRRPKALAVVPQECKSLLSLRNDLTDDLRLAGMVGGEQRFRPHITLARIKSRSIDWACKMPDVADIEEKVGCLSLLRSQLSAKGASYSVISQKTLCGEDVGDSSLESPLV